jgi:hypothetical protein
MRNFKSWGQDFLYLQTYPYRLGRMYATVGDKYSNRPTASSFFVHPKDWKRF